MHTGFVRIWEIRDLIPICESMHMGIAVCIRGSPYAYGQGLLRVRIRGVPVRIMKSCAYGDQHIYIYIFGSKLIFLLLLDSTLSNVCQDQ